MFNEEIEYNLITTIVKRKATQNYRNYLNTTVRIVLLSFSLLHAKLLYYRRLTKCDNISQIVESQERTSHLIINNN